MKKTLLLSSLVFATVLVGCNYPSRSQARQACQEWKRNAETFKYEIKGGGKGQFGNRYCREEEETKQYLGYEAKVIEKDYKKIGRVYASNKEPFIANNRFKVVKHFRY